MESHLISNKHYTFINEWSQVINRLVIQKAGCVYFLDFKEIISISFNPLCSEAIINSESSSYSMSIELGDLLPFLSLLKKVNFIKINESTMVNINYCFSIVEKGNKYILNLVNFKSIQEINIDLIEMRLKLQGIKHVYHTNRKDTKMVLVRNQVANPFLQEKELFNQNVFA